MTVQAIANIEPLERTINELRRTRTATGDDGSSIDIAPFAIRADAGELLSRAVSLIAPETTIEVGCASALSTLFITRGIISGCTSDVSDAPTMHVIDPRQSSHWKNIGRRVIDQANIDHLVQFHEAPAQEVLPRLLKQGTAAQFVFLDGWHMLDHIMVEALYCDLMLDVGGVIAIHDLWMPALQHFASFWITNRAYVPVRVDGDSLSRTPDESIAHDRRLVGDVGPMSAVFREQVMPFVDASILLLQKTGNDERHWDHFVDFTRAEL